MSFQSQATSEVVGTVTEAARITAAAEAAAAEAEAAAEAAAAGELAAAAEAADAEAAVAAAVASAESALAARAVEESLSSMRLSAEAAILVKLSLRWRSPAFFLLILNTFSHCVIAIFVCLCYDILYVFRIIFMYDNMLYLS